MSEKFDKIAVLNWITGGCKNFCVNGHLTRNCHYLSRRRNDCKQRIERQFAGRLQENPEDLIGGHGWLKQLTRKLVFTTRQGNYDTRYEPCWQYDMISLFGNTVTVIGNSIRLFRSSARSIFSF